MNMILSANASSLKEKMMSMKPYLIIMDPMPIEEDFKNYFSALDIELIQQSALQPLHMQEQLPMAFLISRALIDDNPMYIQHLHRTYPIPILVIGDHEDEASKIIVLELGADAYLMSHCSVHELYVRIKSINGRIRPEKRNNPLTRESLHFANWIVYPSSRQVFNQQYKELYLTAGEYNLLLAFLKHPQKKLKRELLLPCEGSPKNSRRHRHVDIQVCRLRSKLEEDVKNPRLIQTIPNYGYLFNACVTKKNRLIHF